MTSTNSDAEDCYTTALRLLQYRWRSEREIDTRLREKGFSEAAVKLVVERLREEKWLDDRRFASEFAHSRRLRHRGTRRIRRELEARGVDRGDAAEAVKTSDPEEREQLILACQKRIQSLSRLRGLAYVRRGDGRRKLTGWLLRQGYDYAAVLEVVEQELGN